MRLVVEPLDGPVDQVPEIRVEQAGAAEPLELELSTTDAAGNRWRFAGSYRTDAGGLDLTRDAPLDGPYASPDPSGPLWAMDFATEDVAPVTFSAPADQLGYELSARAGGGEQAVALVRRWRGPGGEVRPLSGAGFAGSLHLPSAGATGAGVVIVPGSTGPEAMDPMGALLAAHGYPALVAG